MPSFRDYHPEQKDLFGYLDPSERLPPDDLARFVDDLVEQLDLSAFNNRYSAMGSPGYDPRLHLKVFLLGYMEGIHSSRRLMQRCQRDIAFVFLTRGQVPNFRTIARFRQFHSEDLKLVFQQIVAAAREMGLAKLGRVAIDSTTIKANASRGSAMTHDRMDSELLELDAYLKDLGVNDQSEDKALGEEHKEASLPKHLADEASRQERIAVALERQRRLNELKAQAEQSGAKRINATDPDCVFRHDGATKQLVPGYGCQAATSEDGLIIEAQVRSESTDAHALLPVTRNVMTNVGNDLKESELYADTGFFSIAAIEQLDSMGIASLVPDQQTTMKLCGKEFTPHHDGFAYDAQTDTFTCPQGARLGFERVEEENARKRRKRRVYRNKEACRTCSMKETCVGTKFPYKQVRITGEPGQLAQYRGKFDSHATILKYKFRRTIEKVFGHIKGNQRMRQFLTRGLRKVSGEWSLACTAYNILRMWNAKAA